MGCKFKIHLKEPAESCELFVDLTVSCSDGFSYDSNSIWLCLPTVAPYIALHLYLLRAA